MNIRHLPIAAAAALALGTSPVLADGKNLELFYNPVDLKLVHTVTK